MIVIFVEGGLVQAVFTDQPELMNTRICVVDRDDEAECEYLAHDEELVDLVHAPKDVQDMAIDVDDV